MSTVLTPVLIITLGIGWLLTSMGIMPSVNWVWTLGLAIAGLLSFVLGGINKLTVVVGPIMILASLFSLLRQTGRMEIDHEIPILTIALGVLMLIARSKTVPLPEWVNEVAPREK